MRVARRAPRTRAWELGARPNHIVLDIDSTLVTSHSEKEGAAPTYKRGYGFHPIVCYLGGEALAGVLRPGNAGANTAADHISVLIDALDQLPEGVHEDPDTPILVRADSAGCTHAFLDAVCEMGLSFSVSMPIDEAAREAMLAIPETAWTPVRRQNNETKDGAWVTELDGLDITGWPEGSRVICRRERPYPGAQVRFTDIDGHRFQLMLTNQKGEPAILEADHRGRGRIEDAIRCAKDTGPRNLPFKDFAPNATWLELLLVAQDLTHWTQQLLLDGDLARAEPPALPTPAHRRPDQSLRTTDPPAPPHELEVGRRTRPRL